MSDATHHHTIQNWNKELQSVGRIEFKSKPPQIAWLYLLLSFSFIIFMMWVAYVEGRFTWLQATLSTIVVLGSILVLIVWSRVRHSNRPVIVEQDSIRLVDGTRMHWSEIISVRPYNHAKSRGSGLLFEVTQPTWDRYFGTLGFWGRINRRLNRMVLRGRMIHMPSHLDVEQSEFVAWVNSFVHGKKEAEGERQLW